MGASVLGGVGTEGRGSGTDGTDFGAGSRPRPRRAVPGAEAVPVGAGEAVDPGTSGGMIWVPGTAAMFRYTLR
ncbi:hypothetical protein CF54_08260 [Streptomyces sp. Tu 6176]|nr:hypothetical protein CF54_08260 [Streptomyces sp. Tu 6176]